MDDEGRERPPGINLRFEVDIPDIGVPLGPFEAVESAQSKTL